VGVVAKNSHCYIGQFDLFDESRKLDRGQIYSGEYQLACVCSETLAFAVKRVVEEIINDGVKIKTIERFGLAEDFSGNLSFFDLSMNEFVSHAKKSGRVAYSNAMTYQRNTKHEIGRDKKRLFIGQFDLFDPDADVESGRQYAGELSLAGVYSENIEKALQLVISEIVTKGISLKMIDYFGPIQCYSGNISLFNTNAKEFSDDVRKAEGVFFSDSVGYEKDD
jgi:hypothetical protein